MRLSVKLKIPVFCMMFLFVAWPEISMAVIHISPEVVKIDTMFNGTTIYVSGEIDKDLDVAVQLMGNAEESHFKQKGKVGGILWMTVGHLTFEGAPSAYFVYLPKNISSWKDSKDPRWKALGIDYDTVFSRITITPEPKNKDKILNDFLTLKTKDSLYQMVSSGIVYKPGENGKKQYVAAINIPAKMPVDKYKIRVLEIENGRIIGKEEGQIEMKETGFPLFISRMAFDHKLIYGILAVFVAVIAGLFMGVLFKDKGAAH